MHGPLEFDEVDRARDRATRCASAAFVACISDFCRAQLMRLVEPEHWDKLHVVHCGVEPERYAGAAARRRRDVGRDAVGRPAGRR